MLMQIPVLTYHATNIFGNEYSSNDHIALAHDLKLLLKQDITILSAHKLIQWMNREIHLDKSKHYVVITFDDGSELDFTDWHHPTCGFQKSFYTTMQEYMNSSGRYIHATSFVIASARARKTLEQTCLGGHQMWGDNWWQKAEDSQLISIENHSWDHLHPTLNEVSQTENLKGDFSVIKSYIDANQQIYQSSKYINQVIKNKTTTLFAYPYGDFSDYLTDQYFPNSQKEIKGAFTCEASHVSQQSNIWKIPRYVCGSDWKSIEELESILIAI